MRQETFPSYEEREKKCASVCVYVYVCVRINVCKWGRSTVGQGAAVATKKKKKNTCVPVALEVKEHKNTLNQWDHQHT